MISKPPNMPTQRFVSLDAMRGFTMMSMILVNNPGTWSAVYSPLLHKEWHGCTFTDLIFPFFLFMVGVAMPFAFEKRLAQGIAPSALLPKVIKRTLVLFFLGIMLGIFPELLWQPSVILEARIPGVLQRIAICYFVVSLMALYLNPIGRLISALTLICIYWLGMQYFPVPGYGSGIYEPYGNFAWWLDNQLLKGHTWQHAPAEGFDPEGVWSTLTAIVTTLIGYFAGLWIRKDNPPVERLSMLFLFGVVLLGLAYILSPLQPINKQLWTVPYLFLTGGLALIVLALFYYVIDIQGCKTGITPMLVFGTNAIFAYVLASAGASILGSIQINQQSLKSFLHDSLFLSWLSPINASLAMGIAYVIVCLLIIYPFYNKQIYLRI